MSTIGMGHLKAAECARSIGPKMGCILVDQNLAASRPRGSCAGKSIIELIWDQLLEAYGDILSWKPDMNDPDRPDWMHQDDALDKGELRGRAQGLATALAILANPYLPNVDTIRQEVVERWESSQKPEKS